jgi:hypothetical protein
MLHFEIPFELWFKIFTLLPLREIFNIRRVDTTWLSVCNSVIDHLGIRLPDQTVSFRIKIYMFQPWRRSTRHNDLIHMLNITSDNKSCLRDIVHFISVLFSIKASFNVYIIHKEAIGILESFTQDISFFELERDYGFLLNEMYFSTSIKIPKHFDFSQSIEERTKNLVFDSRNEIRSFQVPQELKNRLVDYCLPKNRLVFLCKKSAINVV